MTNSLLYDLVNQMYLNTDRQDESPKDKIFEAECQVVRNLAKKGNCVIVGRCAETEYLRGRSQSYGSEK